MRSPNSRPSALGAGNQFTAENYFAKAEFDDAMYPLALLLGCDSRLFKMGLFRLLRVD